jgi:hypothetical protein
MNNLKLAVFLGGPFHGHQKWTKEFIEIVEIEDQSYRYAFGDEYVGIYYWKLNDFQVKAVRQQVLQLRVRHDGLEEESP